MVTPFRARQALMRCSSVIMGHFFIKWLVRLSMRPLEKCSPQSLQVCGYLVVKNQSSQSRALFW